MQLRYRWKVDRARHDRSVRAAWKSRPGRGMRELSNSLSNIYTQTHVHTHIRVVLARCKPEPTCTKPACLLRLCGSYNAIHINFVVYFVNAVVYSARLAMYSSVDVDVDRRRELATRPNNLSPTPTPPPACVTGQLRSARIKIRNYRSRRTPLSDAE